MLDGVKHLKKIVFILTDTIYPIKDFWPLFSENDKIGYVAFYSCSIATSLFSRQLHVQS